MIERNLFILAAAASILSSNSAWAHGAPAKPTEVVAVERGAREPAAMVDAFHAALTSANIPAALAHLSEDAIIFESGGVERGKKEYAAHHAAADAAFAKAVPSKTIRRSGRASGDLAWILTEGRTTGTFEEKAVDRLTTETMLLRRHGGVWRIVHVHWSSAAAPGATK
jgi:ketosteroid isomerase-like protein